ncbi:MAG TPA: phage holin family protein [Propionibacteriaceae bacterium]|nr:phage holin family protein [Propionibacteriaceae bacterium]
MEAGPRVSGRTLGQGARVVGVSERGQAQSRARLRLGDIARLVAVWLVASLALALADALLPNLKAEAWWAYPAATAVAGLLGLVFRPLLVLLVARIGWLAVVLAGLVGQALLVYAGIWIVPDISATFWSAFWASWIVAVIATAAAWLGSAGTDDSFTAALLRRRVAAKPVSDPEVDGVVFVQLDGVAFPVLRWAIQAGRVQTLRRWVTSGDYLLREWTVQLPCTTPASQLGILHGTVAGVPAFRWYDRELGRVLIANRAADAAVIEQRATTGVGLLADDGVALGNLFTGDAPRAMLTMSRLGSGRGSEATRQTFAWFLTNPNGFTRGLVRTVAEIMKERWQAARQRRLDILPRIHRGWTFAALRAATNVLQRDLNTAVIAEEMQKGTKCIYVDYVDYDEIAHHAGMFRPESLAALDGLDRVLGTLERLAAHAARRYHIVVLSDHGQSQGQSFQDRFGADLGEVCTKLMDEQVASLDAPVEDWGRVESLAGDLSGSGLSGRAASRAASVSRRHIDQSADAVTSADLTVLGSGNLGMLYIHSPVRLTLEDLQARWPKLISGLCAHDGVGFVAGVDSSGLPWAIGATGRIRLDTGEVAGEDPLRPYRDHAARVLRRAVMMPEAPDLYVNSRVDDVTLDIAAFEPLVGAHGGLGGWQDRAVLLTPRRFMDVLPAEHIEGADHLHDVLVAMLRAVGQRRTIPGRDDRQSGPDPNLSAEP